MSTAPATLTPAAPPPHSLQAEEAVLGAVLLTPKVLAALRLEEGLAAEHFYRDRHRVIFDAMCALADRGAAIDVLTVTVELDNTGKLAEVGGRGAVDELTGGVPMLGAVRRYAQIVSEHWVRRERLSSAYGQMAAILNHDDDAWQREMQRAHAVVAAGVSDGYLGKDVLADHMLRWLEEKPDEGLPVPSELAALGRKIRLRAGHLTVLAAWPSGGKTATALQLASSFGAAGHRTVVWTNEDTAEELVAKHVMARTGVPAWAVSDRRLSDEQFPLVFAELGRLPFEVQPCHDWTAAQVATHIRQVAPTVAVVDHFHNLQGIGTVPDVDESIRVLAAVAGQAGCHLVLCAQLNRNRLNGVCKPPPVAADLRGSAMFLAACHTMLLTHRDEEEMTDGAGGKIGKARQLDTGSITVAKNKVTGRTGVVSVVFDEKRLRFVQQAGQSAVEAEPVVQGSQQDWPF